MATFRILVTGGGGFLGRAVIKALNEKHPTWTIDALDIHPPDEDTRQLIDQFFQTDIRSEANVNAAFSNYHPDIVVHTAGIVTSRELRYSTKDSDWERVKAINYDGTVHILNATLAAGCTRFVYTSSVTAIIDDLDHDYHNMHEDTTPTGLATLHYGRSKGLAEAFVLSPSHAQRGLKACALRPCTVIGPDDTQVLSLLHDLIAKGETHFIIGDGHNLYDWVYISNAADAHVLAIENLLPGGTGTAAGEAIFVTNHEPAYFWDFLAFVWAQFGHEPRVRVHVPVALAVIVAWVLEVLTWVTGRRATLDRGSVKDGYRTHYASPEKAARVLGYMPRVGLSEGVRRSCEGFKKRLEEERKVKLKGKEG